MASTRTGWGTLPAELRTSIIRTACEEAQGDPDDLGSCRRMATAGLNTVNKEFEAIASPMQWHHLELSRAKDVGVFLSQILPKHAADCRKVSLLMEEEEATADWPRGHAAALDTLEAANHPVPRDAIDYMDSLLYALFRHTFTVATAVQSVYMSHPDCWTPQIVSGYSSMAIGIGVRKLELCCYDVDSPPRLGEMLRLVRSTLEELFVTAHYYQGAVYDQPSEHHQLFASWPPTHSLDEPRLPKLRVLATPEDLLYKPEGVDAPLISEALRQLTVVPNLRRNDSLLDFIVKHAGSIESVDIDERPWIDWEWDTVFDWGRNKILLVKELCSRHQIAFRWMIARDKQMKGDPDTACPADLVGLIELV